MNDSVRPRKIRRHLLFRAGINEDGRSVHATGPSFRSLERMKDGCGETKDVGDDDGMGWRSDKSLRRR